MKLVGIALVAILLVIYVVALRFVIKSPFRALGVLVAGMMVHNFVLMILLRLQTPTVLVRLAQAWKEGILLLLLVLAVLAAYRQLPKLPRLRVLDWMLIAFTGIVLLYFLLPSSLLHGPAGLTQRVLGLRVLLLIPLLYFFGRIFPPQRRSDLTWVATLLVGCAALVGVFGMVELWVVPTRQWLQWGVNQYSAWLGFTYHGPAGLPENFFQTSAEGLLLRRMVSTYVSPLGVAYTGLLVVPLAVALLVKKSSRALWWFAAIALVLTLLGIFFSVTRLALVAVVLEFALMYLLWRRRWLIPATLLVGVAAVFMIYQYPYFGPLLDRDLQPVNPRPAKLHIANQADPSGKEHLQELLADLDFVRLHPLGTGLGTSVHRFGVTAGTGESAVFDVFGEVGVVGGLLYVAIYLAGIAYGLRAFLRHRDDPLACALAVTAFVGGLALVPITLTSDVWSDFSVTFLFWWAVGYSVTLASGATTTLSRMSGPVGAGRPRGFAEPDALVV
jgi:hypothetical protein